MKLLNSKVVDMINVIIIGGGASGMMAALVAARSPENRVVLLERQQRVGRKLLSTGNGRCNLTNTGAAPANYHGQCKGFANSVLSAFPPAAALEFFRTLGLVTVEEWGGRVYPLSNSANSVVDVLRFALDRAGVEVRTACPVRNIARRGSGFLVSADEDSLIANKLIVACGGAAGAKLGGVMDGYALLAPLCHERTKLYPALVQLVTAPEYPRALKGVRADAAVALVSGNKTIAEGAGELQFTDNGISGPAAYDISRMAAVAGGNANIVIDFMRQYSIEDVFSLLCSRSSGFPALTCQELFTGILHNRLGRMVVKYCSLSPNMPMGELRDEQLWQAARACKSFTLRLIGTESFDSAQVTAGGLKTQDFDSVTLESRLVKGLFVCGELLDVDGDCGGYNLQWAWASGYVAGRLGE